MLSDVLSGTEAGPGLRADQGQGVGQEAGQGVEGPPRQEGRGKGAEGVEVEADPERREEGAETEEGEETGAGAEIGPGIPGRRTGASPGRGRGETEAGQGVMDTPPCPPISPRDLPPPL